MLTWSTSTRNVHHRQSTRSTNSLGTTGTVTPGSRVFARSSLAGMAEIPQRRYLRGRGDSLIHRAVCWACHAHSRAFPTCARSGSDRNRTIHVRRVRHGLHHAGVRAAASRRDVSAGSGGLGSRWAGLHLVVSSASRRVRERTAHESTSDEDLGPPSPTARLISDRRFLSSVDLVVTLDLR
jgi:hypothetical protein